MKQEDFQKLKDLVEQELKLTPENVMDKSLQLSNFYIMFLKIHSREKRNLEVKKLERERVYGELYHWYKFNIADKSGAKFEYQLGSMSEIDVYVKSNPQYHQVALECSNIETQINFLSDVLVNINKMSFSVSNYLGFLKISKGLM